MESNDSSQQAGMALVVERNIRALLARTKEVESKRGWQERLADAITRFAGSMRFVYWHLLLYGVWILVICPGLPFPKFDPTYVVLAMFASVEAIFLSTFILISQNRMAAVQEERAQLDLQVSLLAEHEVTRLITLVKAMALKMGVEEAADDELPELQRDVQPGGGIGENGRDHGRCSIDRERLRRRTALALRRQIHARNASVPPSCGCRAFL